MSKLLLVKELWDNKAFPTERRIYAADEYGFITLDNGNREHVNGLVFELIEDEAALVLLTELRDRTLFEVKIIVNMLGTKINSDLFPAKGTLHRLSLLTTLGEEIDKLIDKMEQTN